MQLLGWGVTPDISFSRELDCLLSPFTRYAEALRFTKLSMLEAGDPEFYREEAGCVSVQTGSQALPFPLVHFLNGVLGVYQVLNT